MSKIVSVFNFGFCDWYLIQIVHNFTEINFRHGTNLNKHGYLWRSKLSCSPLKRHISQLWMLPCCCLDHAQPAWLVFEGQTQGNETGSPVPYSEIL